MFTNSFSRKVRAGAVALFLAPFASVAQADGTVVVELYTSQGCSSCPAADKVLRSLKNNPNIIALSLNVDYWDYLGWKDDLALPGNAKRQRKYAKIQRSRHVYTPQMMVDGSMDVVGSRPSQVDSAIANYARNEDRATVSAQVAGDSVSLSVSPRVGTNEEAVVWLVGYDSKVERRIGGGENRGRTVEYGNVVREWREVGRWDGKTNLTLRDSKPAGNGGFAVIVQQGEVGPIYGATKVSY
jgi:hypothetical protein